MKSADQVPYRSSCFDAQRPMMAGLSDPGGQPSVITSDVLRQAGRERLHGRGSRCPVSTPCSHESPDDLGQFFGQHHCRQFLGLSLVELPDPRHGVRGLPINSGRRQCADDLQSAYVWIALLGDPA